MQGGNSQRSGECCRQGQTGSHGPCQGLRHRAGVKGSYRRVRWAAFWSDTCSLNTSACMAEDTQVWGARLGKLDGKRTEDKKRPLGGTEAKGPGTRIFKRSKQRRAPGREQAEGQEATVRGQNVRMSDCRGKATGGVTQRDTEAPWQEWGERGRVRIQNAPQPGATQRRPIPRGTCSVALRQWAQAWEAEKSTAEQ